LGDTRIGGSDAASRRLKFNIPLGLVVIDILFRLHDKE
jgi:hypothetical protein